MSKSHAEITEEHIELIKKALKRGNSVQVCTVKDEVRIYERKERRINIEKQ